MDWAQIQENALSGKRLIALSDMSAILILSLSEFYRPRYRWNFEGAKPNDAQWDEIEGAISRMEDEIMAGIVGMIFPHAGVIQSGLVCLPCDGAIYQRVDYPRLYEALDPIFIIDADTFTVPDLREKFVLGVGGAISIGETGGEVEHVLTESEMPSHTHANLPHSHTESIAFGTLNEISAGVPTPSAVPAAGLTGAASITIEPSGGNEAHNNMPPYIALNWFIVAG